MSSKRSLISLIIVKLASLLAILVTCQLPLFQFFYDCKILHFENCLNGFQARLCWVIPRAHGEPQQSGLFVEKASKTMTKPLRGGLFIKT